MNRDIKEDIAAIADLYGCTERVLGEAVIRLFERHNEKPLIIGSAQTIILYAHLFLPKFLAMQVKRIQDFIKRETTEEFFFSGGDRDMDMWSIIVRRYWKEMAPKVRNKAVTPPKKKGGKK